MQSSDDLELTFKHELCSYPPALFDSSLLLLEADKPALADALWKVCENEVPAYIPDDGIQYILDGMEEHFYNASHGLAVLHMETSTASK